MKASEFSFDLPHELIAQQPTPAGRDRSRLMVLDRKIESIDHRHFFELPRILRRGDLLVLNDSKVIPARLIGRKIPTGGKIEVLFLRLLEGNEWEVLVSGHHAKKQRVQFGSKIEGFFSATIEDRCSRETFRFSCDEDVETCQKIIAAVGSPPIPPYLAHTPLCGEELRQAYQTLYAKHPGSVAAPTAGLHFSNELLNSLDAAGMERVFITLHVGFGTFAPIKVDDIESHRMHVEYAVVSEETADRVNQAREEGRRIIAVGTTSARTLESFMGEGMLQSGAKWIKLFITPGYRFQCTDGLITNFHLPHSTLLVLVSAFAHAPDRLRRTVRDSAPQDQEKEEAAVRPRSFTGIEFIRRAYREAIAKRYRFYSFGDAMLII